ncbi:MAG: tetratricopeptide repeat protein, partial [Pseudomonadota bacterium]
SRRLLAAASQAEREAVAAPAPRGASRALAAVLVIAVLGGGGALYAVIGQPGAPDRPLAARMEEMREAQSRRPSQAEAERLYAERLETQQGELPEPPATADDERLRELVGRLRGILEERPKDIRGRRLLADSLMRLDDLSGARAALQEVVDLQGEGAPAGDRAALAEAMVLAAGGYVSPEAERQLRLALQADQSEPVARYYAGLASAQGGNYELALNFWRGLLEEGPEDAPWIAPIRAQIGELEQAAREASGAPAAPAMRGPDAGDMEAARDMAPEDRAAMIEGMVARLEGRLAEEGGPPQDWARLIRAYGVLGRMEDAARIWTDAQRAFAEAPPEVLERLEAAAREAGVETKQ